MTNRDWINAEVVDVVSKDSVLDQSELSGVLVRCIHNSDHVTDPGVIVHPELVFLSQHITSQFKTNCLTGSDYRISFVLEVFSSRKRYKKTRMHSESAMINYMPTCT